MQERRLHRTLRALDRRLSRPALKAMDARDAERALNDVERFYRQAQDKGPDTRYLVAAGCRLSADLNEAVIEQLAEALQEQDQAIQRLAHELKQRLQARNQTARLLHKAQALRQQTADMGQATGLGLIL